MTIRVLIAEDQRLLRQCFEQLLQSDPEIDIVGTAANGEEAVLEAVNQRPDIAILDLEMPVLNGAQATALIRKRVPSVKVLILSRHESAHKVRRATVSGVHGYVTKDVPPEELIRIVKAVHRGQEVDSPFLADVQLQAQRDRLEAQFSARELQLLRLLKLGLTDAEMAARVLVSEQTVKRDMMHILAKLGVHNRTLAAVRAVELGLAVEEDPSPQGETRRDPRR